MKPTSDPQLAHALARLGLGINIFMHGVSRLPQFDEFAGHLHEQFATTWLPSFLVTASAYGIVTAECVIGFLLLLGWHLRATLVAGCLLMCALLFGICLIQNWSVAGDQLIYLAFFAALLATRRFSCFSIDGRTESAGH